MRYLIPYEQALLAQLDHSVPYQHLQRFEIIPATHFKKKFKRVLGSN